MLGGAVFGAPVDTRILLLGQAPGLHEGPLGRPFAYTAGKTLFKWLHEAIGADEATVRDMIYFSAVARCFPGKATHGAGDRVPDRTEIQNCRSHLALEVEILKPELILAVGRLAMTEALGPMFKRAFTLNDVVGQKFSVTFHGIQTEVIPLPHPSGVSRWPHSPEGRRRLAGALALIREHFQRA